MKTPGIISDHPVHSEIMDRLLSRLDYIRLQPASILIVGDYAAEMQDKLQQRYPSATIQHTADLTQIQNNSIDLVVAYFALLETSDPILLLRNISRVLHDEALLLFTSLGPDTFFELRDGFSVVDNDAHTLAFLDMHHLGDWMKQLYFSDPVVDREEIIIAYDTVNSLCDDLKTLKMKNNHPSRRRGLMTSHQWQAMLSRYAEHKVEDYFPATLEVIFGHGWKSEQLEKQAESPDEIAISVDNIFMRSHKQSQE